MSATVVDVVPDQESSLSWQDIRYEVDIPPRSKGEPVQIRSILKGITGAAAPGRMLAIMGASGSGKTTLLNCLANRMEEDAVHRFSGAVAINGVPYDERFRRIMSFVSQDDVVFDSDTPREALYFNVRIKTGMSAAAAEERVQELLELLRITKCADTIIGTPGVVRGISGGERKRTNIG
eukprot:PhM_4_TR13723/c0_g1_i1/m.82053